MQFFDGRFYNSFLSSLLCSVNFCHISYMLRRSEPMANNRRNPSASSGNKSQKGTANSKSLPKTTGKQQTQEKKRKGNNTSFEKEGTANSKSGPKTTEKQHSEEGEKKSNDTSFEEEGTANSKSGPKTTGKQHSEEGEKKSNDTSFEEEGTANSKSGPKTTGKQHPDEGEKKSNDTIFEEGFPPGFPLAPIAKVSLAIVAVALLVAVFTGRADFGSLSESVIESINKAYSVIFNFLSSFANSISIACSIICNFIASSDTCSSIYNFLMSSTNSNFCNPNNNNTCDEFLHQKFRNLGLKYNEQSSGTWHTLYAAALDHVKYQANPERPIVIMVYRLKDGLNITQVVEDIARAYDSVLPPHNDNGDIIISGSSFIDSPPEETQKQIQDMLENGFENKGQKVAIVYDFDKLPSCSVLTFHNYCNNDDAPHKNVAIILTVTGMEEELPSDPKSSDLEKVVNELFHEKWKDCPKELPPGKIDAMLSRIANNVILLR